MIASSTSRDDPQTSLPVAQTSIVLVLVVPRPSSSPNDLKTDCANVAVVEPYRTWGLVIGL